jgi:hypothetical protein
MTLTEHELKDRLAVILAIEDNEEHADWFAIASMSVELSESLPRSAPDAVRHYLRGSGIRRVNSKFADSQRSALLSYLRS